VTGGGDITARAAAYGVPAKTVDGNDLWAVSEAAVEAVARARAGEGPTLLECQTYRHHGHSKADPGKYRPPEEVERWLAHDPLNVARERLRQLGVSDDEVAGVEQTTKLRIDRAVESALAAPYPDPVAEHATEFAP
jgi:acetoin:2,6-dichlorophenolindophenol oxidoreductase subunit alpha